MTFASKAIVDHVLGRDWDALSAAGQECARVFLKDTLCVGVAGRSAPQSDAIYDAALRWGGTGSACVLGRPEHGTSPPYAAFANAFQIHAQEFDCVHEGAVAHPLATIVAALLSHTDQAPVTGRDMLTAMVAGVDVVAALGLAATTPLKFFRPATAGIFGSVAALARLRRLERDTTLDAFGHALAFASGTMQAHVEGKAGLALQAAAAARSAVEAIDLALLGVSAPRGSIDGPFGYLSLFEDGYDLQRVLPQLANRERICELSWKPFPTGRAAHGAIVALQTMLRAPDIELVSLRRFVYRAPPLIARLVGRRPTANMTAPYARLCFAYLGAVTLRNGTVGLADFADAALTDPETLALAERFSVEDDGNPDPAAFLPAEAILETSDGQRLSLLVTEMLGGPSWPLSRAQQWAKVQECLTFGGWGDRAEQIGALCDAFDQVEDVAVALRAAFSS